MMPVAADVASDVPRVGMRVRCVLSDHKDVPFGREGTIDIVHKDGILFQVATDCGGFFAWTTFASWAQIK